MADLRFIKDFPKDGVTFVDISPKLADKQDFNNVISKMAKEVPADTDYIISPESRGYIFGPAVAYNLSIGFVPVRKPNKLPNDVVTTVEYEKEYGIDILCLPKNENYVGKSFYFLDDVLATGGTLDAVKKLVNKVGGKFVGAGVYINLVELNNESDIHSVEELKF